MRIPVEHLKRFSSEHGLSHAILFAWDGEAEHVVTYGKTIEACSQAADFGNRMKHMLGWPDSLQAQSSRMKRLQARLKEAEDELTEIRCKNEWLKGKSKNDRQV